MPTSSGQAYSAFLKPSGKSQPIQIFKCHHVGKMVFRVKEIYKYTCDFHFNRLYSSRAHQFKTTSFHNLIMQFALFFLPLFLGLLPVILAHPFPQNGKPVEILIQISPNENKIQNFPLCYDKDSTEQWKEFFNQCINVSIYLVFSKQKSILHAFC